MGIFVSDQLTARLAEAGALRIRADYTVNGLHYTEWEELESVGLGLFRRRMFRKVELHTHTWSEVIEMRPALTEITGGPLYEYGSFSFAHQQNPNAATNTSHRKASRSNNASNTNSNIRRKNKFVGLSPCVKRILENYIDREILDQIRISTDGLPTIIELTEYISGPKGAMTWGNDVYFAQ
jgi:hypothetical protein